MVSGPGRWVGIPECTRPNVSEPTSTGIGVGRGGAATQNAAHLDLYLSRIAVEPHDFAVTGLEIMPEVQLSVVAPWAMSYRMHLVRTPAGASTPVGRDPLLCGRVRA